MQRGMHSVLASDAQCRQTPGVCLVLFALRSHPDFPLVLAANRDEFFARPTAPLAPWPGRAGVVAGRDGLGGGSWLGMSATGRVAALTNYRNGLAGPAGTPSRGRLVVDYLEGTDTPAHYLRALEPDAERYAGFNLLVGVGCDLWYFGNHEGRVRRCEDGVHGLSNHLLDTPWPKVELGRARLAEALQDSWRASHRSRDECRQDLVQRLFRVLDDSTLAADERLPNTGIPIELERALSGIRVRMPTYGTRSSSVLLVDRDGALHLTELTLGVGDQVAAERAHSLPPIAAHQTDALIDDCTQL